MNSVKESVLRKIRKALALAHDHSNAEESQSAMLLAQRLMAKHNVAASDITDVSKKDVTKRVGRSYSQSQRIAWWQVQLGSIVAENFRCYLYRSGGHVVFLGLEEDVPIASDVFEFASSAIRHASSQYLLKNRAKRTRQDAIARKNEYIHGFLDGLREKFKEQVESESMALVLVKDGLVVQAYEEMEFKSGRRWNITRSFDDEARLRGYMDGKTLEKPKAALKEG